MQWSTAAAALLAFLVFSTAVYAAVVFIGQRFDTGGSTEFIFVDREGHAEFWADAFHGNTIYRSPSGTMRESEFFMFAGAEFWAQFDADTAQIVNEMLDGRVFTADGNPFRLVVPIPNWEYYPLMYRADDRGHTLFNAYNEEIDTITLVLRMDDNTPQWVDVLNESEAIARVPQYNDTFEDAVQVLGNIRLPNIEGFDEPVFEVNNVPGHYWDTGYEKVWIREFRNVFIRYRPIGQPLYMGFMLWIEPIRPETQEPHQLPILYGEVYEHTVGSTTVYELIEDGNSTTFIWHYDGLVYRLSSPTDALTTAQSMEIIRSMIE
jgi:hypothetical protein